MDRGGGDVGDGSELGVGVSEDIGEGTRHHQLLF